MFEDNKYTGKDIKSIREEIIEFIKGGNEDWTDFNMSSIQLQFTEIVAGVADMLCYYLDNQALETFLMSARQSKNINGILTTMNYKIERIGTARGEVEITRNVHEAGMRGDDGVFEEGRFLIPKFTIIDSTDPNVPKYVTIEEKSMSSNENKIIVPIVQGKKIEVNIPIDVIKESYKIYLTERLVPLDYVEIVDEGWERVEDAFIEIKGGKKYSVHADSKDMVYILFTFDWTRYLSTEEGAVMKIRYIESLGADGKVDSYQLNRIASPVIDLDTEEEDFGRLGVTNSSATYGAFSKVNLNRQKANARNYLKVYDRIILLEDLEVMVRKETWIKDCVCFDWRRNIRVVPFPHQMKAWVVTVDGVDVQGELLKELTNKLQKLTVCMTEIEVKSAEFVNFTTRVGISVTGNNDTVRENVRSKVEKKLNERYSMKSYLNDDENSKLKFGMELRVSMFESEIYQMSSAINNVELDFNEDIQLTETQFLNVANIEVYLI